MVERHARAIAAPPEAVWDALHRADFGRSRAVRLLLWLRGLGRRSALRLADVVAGGFVALGARPPNELALGAVGRFWTPSGGRRRLADADAFRRFEEAGCAKAAWDFRLEPSGDGTLLSTETRVYCLDAKSRRRFLVYWRLIGPFSGLIRREILKVVAREAERR